MPVFGYARVSTALQANEGESLDVQRRQIEGWCQMQGLELTELFVERGVSGSIPVAERQAGSVMWSKLRQGDMIIAAKLDRLFRSALDALQAVETLKNRGVSLVLLDLGGDISGNGLSKLFLTIAAAFAEAERDRIRERIVQVKRDQRQRGRYLGGIVPFGYRRGEGGDLVPDAVEQTIIHQARELRGEGNTLRAIQGTIEAQHGKRLSLDALHRVLAEQGVSPGRRRAPS
ncbi:MAG: recombinase family protein [Candidatus Binatia bacterium]